MSKASVPDFESDVWWDEALNRSTADVFATAQGVLADLARSSDERALAARTLVRALFEQGVLAHAAAAARSALRLASNATPRTRRLVVLSCVVVLAENGELDEGLAALDALLGEAQGIERGRVMMQRAYLLHHAGRLIESLAWADRSMAFLDDESPLADHVRMRLNRGLILLQLARFAEAEEEFVVVIRTARTAAFEWSVALAHGNLGVLYGRSHRLPEALRHFSIAEDLYRRESRSERALAILHIDRAEVFMHAGMHADGVDAARSALEIVRSAGNAVQLGDAELMMARAELAAGQARSALRSAEQAAGTFERTGRTDMQTHARALVALAGMAAASSPSAVAIEISAADAVASDLRAGGWVDQADALAAAAVRAGWCAGLPDVIVGAVDFLRARRDDARRDVAVAGWYAEGVSRLIASNPVGALAACRTGLGMVAEIVAEAPDLQRRSAATRLGADLDDLALEAALSLGDVGEVLDVAEQTRARALSAEQDLGVRVSREPLVERVTPLLGSQVLIVWAIARGRLHAVVVGDGAPRLVDVAAVADVVRARDRVVRWLDLAGSEPASGADAARRSADSLEALLFAPLDLPDGAPLVLVPAGPVCGTPWGALRGLADRVVVEAPSIGLWRSAEQRAAASARSVGAVIGPDVDGAEAEREALLAAYPHMAIASGQGATPKAAAALLRDCDLVHLAAHGRFRADRPLMSSVQLVEGEALLADLLPERVAARLVVLSSCEGGAHGTAGGSEALGLAALLLARGAGAVVAALSVVCDLACADFVAELHTILATGTPVGEALATIRREWLDSPTLDRWAIAAAFTCYGSSAARVGDTTLHPEPFELS